MTLYRCNCPAENPRGILIHRVHKDENGKWVRVMNGEPVTKIMKDGIVLKLEVARLVSPFISVNWDSQRTSEYHICLYKDYTVAITDEKWWKNFIPIETNLEE